MRRRGIGTRLWGFFKPVAIVFGALIAGVGATFLVSGEFTLQAYSSRLFWAGIGAVIVAGFGVWASLGSYSTLGTPSVLTAPADARIAHERIGEQIKMNAGRYVFTFRMVVVSVLTIGLSALIEVLSR